MLTSSPVTGIYAGDRSPCLRKLLSLPIAGRYRIRPYDLYIGKMVLENLGESAKFR